MTEPSSNALLLKIILRVTHKSLHAMSLANLQDLFPAHTYKQLYILNIQHHTYLQRILMLITGETSNFSPSANLSNC